MQKIIAFIMAIFMLLGSLVPAWAANTIDGVTTGDWIQMVVEEFNMEGSDYSREPYFDDVLPDNSYFKYVQIAYEWGVLTDDDAPLAIDANVTNEFVAVTLVRVAGIELGDTVTISNAQSLANPNEVAAAVEFGLFELDFFKRFNVKVISLEDAKAALAKVKEWWSAKKFGAPAAEEISEDVLKFSGDVEPALEVAEFIAGNGTVLQNAYVPLDDPAGITQEQIDIAGLLKKLDVNFSLKGFDFGLKVTETGFNLKVGTGITEGVYFRQDFIVSDLNVSTKFDGNLAARDVKEAYIRADYDMKSVTTLTGSYATSLAVDQSKLPEDAGPVDFMTAAKAGALALMPGGGNKITVFSVNVPIPNLPAITISLDVNLRITVDGKIQITIETSNVKGVEIVNNKVRIINETVYGQQTYDIMADVRFTVGLCFSIKALGYILVDVEFEAGIGIKVTAYIKTDTAVYTLEMPLDLAMEIPYPTGGMDGAEFCGNAKIYGVMYASVGKNSPLLKLVGLSKSWTIFDENNAVIYNFHIEETGVVPECTRART